MKVHKMTLKQPYFDLICAGQKTIELRMYDEKRKEIQIGDQIEFTNQDKKCLVNVKGFVRAQTFKDLFQFVDVQKTGLETVEKAINIMQEFYDLDYQKKIGVVGICIELAN
jgi:ASC-1-like (ASCH) protein